MLNYTKASISLILEDFKRYSRIFRTFSLVFTTLYFLYVLITRSGFLVANIILAVLFLGYTIFDIVTMNKDLKKLKKIIQRTYSWLKLSINFITLIAVVYGIYTATTDVKPITTIFTTLMIVFWVFQVILELIIQILESKVDLLIAAINKDVENVMKPVDSIKNIFKKVKGEPLPPVKEKTKEIIRIEKRLDTIELEKQRIKEEAKEAKKLTKKPSIFRFKKKDTPPQIK